MSTARGTAGELLRQASANGWSVMDTESLRRRGTVLRNRKVVLRRADQVLILEYTVTGRLFRHQTFVPGRSEQVYMLAGEVAVRSVIESGSAPLNARPVVISGPLTVQLY